jgi:hypothetical protein
LAEQKVLTGFDGEDKPILEERKNAITFRYHQQDSVKVNAAGY